MDQGNVNKETENCALAIGSAMPVCYIGCINALIMSITVVIKMPPNSKNKIKMPCKCYLFNQNINLVEINAHYTHLKFYNEICCIWRKHIKRRHSNFGKKNSW